MFNKYGEKTFIVEVLEYLDITDELELKKIEQNYQKQNQNCISLDSNEIFHIERNKEWKEKQAVQLNSIREIALEKCRVPIIVYDIIEKTYTKFEQLIDACSIIEQKHLYKNIKNKILIPYKNRYVAFKEDDFNEENINNIITICTNSYSSTTTICNLYSLIDDKKYSFSSKRQFSLFFSNSCNDKLYDRYLNENIIDFEFRCVYEIKSKNDLLSLNLNLRKRLSKTRFNLKEWYEILLNSNTVVEIANKTKINRSTLQDIFKERSKTEWVQLISQILTRLPD